jgi:hypothetical protein
MEKQRTRQTNNLEGSKFKYLHNISLLQNVGVVH